MQASLIDQGLSLMIYGMGTVFVFLTLLVFATLLMSAIIKRLEPNQANDTTFQQPAEAEARGAVVRAAIQQAITLYRQRHGR